MAFTVVDSRTTFTANDTVGGWDEGTTSYYLGAEFGGREGTGFVGYDIDIETLHNFELDVTIPLDMSGNHYGGFIRVTNGGDLDTKANGGIRLALRDGSGNESYWYVGGKDTYAGGWVYFVCDLDSTPDSNNGTNAVITNAVDLGVGGKLLAKSADDNFQMDIMHYGPGGLTVTGTPDTGTYGTGKSMEEIYDIIDSSNYGGIARQTGSYVFKLPLIIDTEVFDDEDSIIFFEDLPVSSTFYKISLGITQSNDISFSGFTNKTEGDTACELDFSAAVTAFAYDASTALTQGLTTFKSGTYTGNKFVGCFGVTANAGANLDAFTTSLTGLITLLTTATLKNSEITDSTGSASVICESLARLEDNTFNSDGSNHAVELTSIGGGSMNWNNYESGYAASDGSTGNETIFINVASGDLTINVGAGYSTPTIRTAGATFTVVSGQVTTLITVKDRSTQAIIVGARVYLVAAAGGPLTEGTIIFNELTDDNGQVSDTRSLGSNQPVIGRVRKSTVTPLYKTTPVSETIDSANGLTLNVALIRDDA